MMKWERLGTLVPLSVGFGRVRANEWYTVKWEKCHNGLVDPCRKAQRFLLTVNAPVPYMLAS